MNTPCRVPSARAQNHVGSGYGAARGVVVSAQASFGADAAAVGVPASSSGSACSGACVAIGVLFGPTGDTTIGFSVGEPHAIANVKTIGAVCERCTGIVWHEQAATVEAALP